MRNVSEANSGCTLDPTQESGADFNLFSSHRLIVLMVGRVSNLHMSQRVRDHMQHNAASRAEVRDHMQHNAASRAEVKRLCLLSIVRRESCRAIVQYVLLPGR